MKTKTMTKKKSETKAPKGGTKAAKAETPKAKKPMSDQLREKREKLYPGKNFREGGTPVKDQKKKAEGKSKKEVPAGNFQVAGAHPGQPDYTPIGERVSTKAEAIARRDEAAATGRYAYIIVRLYYTPLALPFGSAPAERYKVMHQLTWKAAERDFAGMTPADYTADDTQPCGHSVTVITGSDEGTQYCGDCEGQPAAVKVNKYQDVNNAGRTEVLAATADGAEIYWPDPSGNGWMQNGDAPARPVFGELLTELLSEGLLVAGDADKYRAPAKDEPLPGDVPPPPAGKQQRVDGFSVAQLCRWMGREGFSEKEARAALEAKGIVLVGNAVRSSLGAGRPASPRYDASAIPELPTALANDLRAVLSPKEAAVA